MKKQTFLSLVGLLIMGASTQVSKSSYEEIQDFEINGYATREGVRWGQEHLITKSGARVPFTNGDVSDADTKSIASFFDASEKLNKKELYRYLGHPNIAAGKRLGIGNYRSANMRIPTFVQKLLSTRENFLKSGDAKIRKTQLNDFMEALLQHGNIQTIVGCLVDGSESRCPCCKFENEILLPIFIESVKEDNSLLSKIYNAKLAAIILLFIDQVKSYNLEEVDNFIQMAAGRDKFTLLDLRIRSLLALLNYSVNVAKTNEEPTIKDIHQENAFALANKLAEKFSHENLVDVSILINLSQSDIREMETLKAQLTKTIQEKTASIQGIPSSTDTVKIEEAIRQEKAQLLSLEVAPAKRVTFYHKYLTQFGERIRTIALTLKGEDAKTKQKREQLLHNSETILRLVPQDFVKEIGQASKAPSVNTAEFGSAASQSKKLLLEKASAPRASSSVDTAAFGSTVSQQRAKFAQAQQATVQEIKRPVVAPRVMPKPAPVVAPKPLVQQAPENLFVNRVLTQPEITFWENPNFEIQNETQVDAAVIQELEEAAPVIQAPIQLDNNVHTFMQFFQGNLKNADYLNNQAFNAFLTQFDAQNIITMIQNTAPEIGHTSTALFMRVLMTLVSCYQLAPNPQNNALISNLINQCDFLIKGLCPAGSVRTINATIFGLDEDDSLIQTLTDFINPLL